MKPLLNFSRTSGIFGIRRSMLLLCLALVSAGYAHARGHSTGLDVAPGMANAYGTADRLLSTRQIASIGQTIAASGDPADIYYPDLPQRGAAPARTFPPIILLQGAQVDRQYYSQFAQELARYGFVIIVPDHVSSIFGNGLFSEMNVITNALAHLQAETTDVNSPLYGIVDTTVAGISGHSFGSATALFALANFCTFPFCNPSEGFQLPHEIKAAALVAGNSGAFDLDTMGIPTALLIGDLDTGLADSRATYATLEPPRAFMLLSDANHYGLNDVNQPPNAQVREGEASQTTPQAISASRFAQWSGLFLRAYLYGDQQARRQIYESGGDANTIVTGSEN